jgi:hypothetical protein
MQKQFEQHVDEIKKFNKEEKKKKSFLDFKKYVDWLNEPYGVSNKTTNVKLVDIENMTKTDKPGEVSATNTVFLQTSFESQKIRQVQPIYPYFP